MTRRALLITAALAFAPAAAAHVGAKLTFPTAVSTAAPSPARTIVISVVSTADGPQIYQSGSIKGWTVEESLFLDSNSGAEAMGPLLLGNPAAPESSVTLTTPLAGPPSVKEWIAKDAAWQPEMVLFRSAHRQGGAGMFLDLVAPWPKGTPRLHHLFTY